MYDKVPSKGLKTSVVLDLVSSLPKTKKYDLILDRGFTSPVLLKKLLQRGLTATGTCLRSRKYFPKNLKLPKTANQGELKAMVCEKNKMIALVWKDKKPVHFLSTAKGINSIQFPFFSFFYFFFFFLFRSKNDNSKEETG